MTTTIRRRLCVWLTLSLTVGGGTLADSSPATADETEAINQRLYQQLEGSPSQGKIETVSGQMYIAERNLDAAVIRDALSALLQSEMPSGQAVAVQRPQRLNFEIHFEKNSADLTEESKASLDALAEVLGEDFREIRFLVGGHTDQDGDKAINQPLSQARADSARAYLVTNHSISPDRLVAQGFGSSEPLRKVETSPQDKLYNRRVDLRPLR